MLSAAIRGGGTGGKHMRMCTLSTGGGSGFESHPALQDAYASKPIVGIS